jgi:single-stranded DNA-binding protein
VQFLGSRDDQGGGGGFGGGNGGGQQPQRQDDDGFPPAEPVPVPDRGPTEDDDIPF